MPQTAFSLLVSFLLLIAGFFLGVLANLATPKFQNWWAALSLNRLKKRIETLRAEEMKFKEPISIVESEILRAVENIERYIVLILTAVIALLFAAVLAVHRFVPPRPFSWSRFFILTGILVIVFIVLAKLTLSMNASKFFRSEADQWRLIADLKELEAKLGKWKTKQ